MHRQTMPIVAVSLLVAASALFMGWAALRTTQPIATPTPASPSPAGAVALTTEQSQSGGGSLDLGLLTLELPADWRYQIDAWPAVAPAELADATPLLAAWQGATHFNDAPLRFTVFAVERNELSLERYASDVAEQLAAADGVSDIQTVLDATFRSDTLPVAYLRYTKESAFGRQFGYQVAAFDAHGDHIVIATLVTQSSDGEEILRSLVRSMHFADMPAVPQKGA
ncbi:MAG: hypothetical protein BroJett021_11840 [Chloroflexota bacterium]|nr:hypothetical protein [Caldilinea sp.]GIK72196.1 MAG: hypothetical protein BroJett021_11840 [Chloroflexota bacterium]